jgi:hypothetical protein
VVGFEILDASQQTEKLLTMEYAIAEPASAVREKPAKYGS